MAALEEELEELKETTKRKLIELSQKYHCSPETQKKCKDQMVKSIDHIKFDETVEHKM